MEETKSIPKNVGTAADVEIWKYVFGFTPMAVVKCAIELRIADVLESHGGAMSLPDLSSAINCSLSVVHRIMRYLTHRGIFKTPPPSSSSSCSPCYEQTPLSRLLMQQGKENNSLAPLLLLESSSMMLAPWHNISGRALTNGDPAFAAAHGSDLWKHAEANPANSKLINDAMACHARLAIPAIVRQYPEAFEGVASVVDVGGGDGSALRTLIRVCPWIHGINFDLPHVVAVAPASDGIDHVAGDMFVKVPNADAVFLMWVLHDWSDEECIHILRKCLEAIPKSTGKVMIAEAVIKEDWDVEDKYDDVRLDLDMVMLAHTDKGKERTVKEWEHVIKAAGFSSFTIKHIDAAVVSLIQAYP